MSRRPGHSVASVGPESSRLYLRRRRRRRQADTAVRTAEDGDRRHHHSGPGAEVGAAKRGAVAIFGPSLARPPTAREIIEYPTMLREHSLNLPD